MWSLRPLRHHMFLVVPQLVFGSRLRWLKVRTDIADNVDKVDLAQTMKVYLDRGTDITRSDLSFNDATNSGTGTCRKDHDR